MDFAHVDVWIFDLENTLYPPEMALFPQIEQRMTAYVMRLLRVEHGHADRLRRDYWRRHGTTLAGLMAEHAIDPLAYLAEVHDIDFAGLAAAPDLAARGLDLFEAIYGVEETGFHPKPQRASFDAVIAQAGFDPARAAFFEDDPRNLEVPHELGMRTILVGKGRRGPDAAPGRTDHVGHRTEDLTGFLQTIAARP